MMAHQLATSILIMMLGLRAVEKHTKIGTKNRSRIADNNSLNNRKAKRPEALGFSIVSAIFHMGGTPHKIDLYV